jgi:hypothetical protein
VAAKLFIPEAAVSAHLVELRLYLLIVQLLKLFKNHLFSERPTHLIFTEQVQRLTRTLSDGILEHCGRAKLAYGSESGLDSRRAEC